MKSIAAGQGGQYSTEYMTKNSKSEWSSSRINKGEKNLIQNFFSKIKQTHLDRSSVAHPVTFLKHFMQKWLNRVNSIFLFE